MATGFGKTLNQTREELQMANVKWTMVTNERHAKDNQEVLKVAINPSRTCTIKFGKKVLEHMKAKKGDTVAVCFNPNNIYELMVCKNFSTGYKLGLENTHVPDGLLKINFKARGKMERIAAFSSKICEYTLEAHNQVIITIPKEEKEND